MTRDKGQGTRDKAVWGRTIVAIVVMLLIGSVAAPAATAEQPPPPAQEGFVPVTDVPPEEQLPAAPLVIAAYAIAWIAVIGYLWSIWQRLGRVERELAAISRRVESGARR